GTVTDGMLVCRIHFAERQSLTVRQEHGVIAEASVSAWRPHETAENLTLEDVRFPVRPRKAQCAGEIGAWPRLLPCTSDVQLVGYPLHGQVEVFFRTRPTGFVNTGVPTESLHL